MEFGKLESLVELDLFGCSQMGRLPPIDVGQSQGGGGARARRSSKWKNKEGGGGEGGLAVRPPFKMYVAYGWPKLLSISAGSLKDNFVHQFVLQDWLLLVSSSRVQTWNASQVSE
jgi:hypothetical protein